MYRENNRRSFIKGAVATGVVLSLPTSALSLFDNRRNKVKIGIITDLHQDIMHDGKERMESFLRSMRSEKPDAIMQMGDFAYPGDKNKEVIGMFNDAHKERMHIIGNHDMDSGYTREQCVDYWGMPARYYVSEISGVYFIVLDGNDKGSPSHKGGYASYINEEQASWLEEQLKTLEGPIVIASHQPLAGTYSVDNAEEIQNLLGKYSDKILVAINGHTHIDAHLLIKGVNYVHINSASYYWVGGKFQHKSYSDEVLDQNKYIAYTCPYRDALFTTMTIDPGKQTISFRGKDTEWVGDSPVKLGFEGYENARPGQEIVPEIRKRLIKH